MKMMMMIKVQSLIDANPYIRFQSLCQINVLFTFTGRILKVLLRPYCKSTLTRHRSIIKQSNSTHSSSIANNNTKSGNGSEFRIWRYLLKHQAVPRVPSGALLHLTNPATGTERLTLPLQPYLLVSPSLCLSSHHVEGFMREQTFSLRWRVGLMLLPIMQSKFFVVYCRIATWVNRMKQLFDFFKF